MKKKNREINIFSVSALDLFASAMGAFLLIAIMALPYYLKVDPDLIKQAKEAEAKAKKSEQERQTCENKRSECEEAKAQCETERAKLEAQNQTLTAENNQLKSNQGDCEKARKKLEAENKALKKKNKECQKKLEKTFCVVTIKWESSNNQDVDLHIINGNKEYYFDRLTYNSKAFLAVDSIDVKKGAEVWVHKELKPGKYKIVYVYYKGTPSVKVTGVVLTSSFTKDLPTKTLTHPAQIKEVLKDNTGRWVEVATIIVNENGQAKLELH